jgi:hypothetical protein
MHRRLQHGAGQQQAIGGHHRHIGVQGGKGGLLVLALQREGMAHLDTQFLGALVTGPGVSSRPRRPPGRGGWE